MVYFKREAQDEIVGIGYLDGENKDLMIEMFREVVDFEQFSIGREEFIKLAIENKFSGLIPFYGEVPTSPSF